MRAVQDRQSSIVNPGWFVLDGASGLLIPEFFASDEAFRLRFPPFCMSAGLNLPVPR